MKRCCAAGERGDTSSPNGIAHTLICEHADFEAFEGSVFPFVNAACA